MEKNQLERSLPSSLKQPAEVKCSDKVHETIERFCEVHSRGRRLNEEIHRNRRINNPYFVVNALESYGIQQGASDIVSKKRLRWLDHYEKDSLDALRKYKQSQRQPASTSEAEKNAASKEKTSVKESMTSAQQAAISQFVMDAQQRLQNVYRKKSRFH